MAKIQNPQLYVPSEAEVKRFKKSELEGKCSINSSLFGSLNCFNFTHFEINCSLLNIIRLSVMIWSLFDNVVCCCIETIVEEMIKGLSSVGWERVDVDFHRSKQRNDAHLTIQASFHHSPIGLGASCFDVVSSSLLYASFRLIGTESILMERVWSNI